MNLAKIIKSKNLEEAKKVVDLRERLTDYIIKGAPFKRRPYELENRRTLALKIFNQKDIELLLLQLNSAPQPGKSVITQVLVFLGHEVGTTDTNCKGE